MSKPSLVKRSKQKSAVLSKDSPLRTIFKTELAIDNASSQLRASGGVSALCEAYLAGYTTTEIAEYLGCTTHAVLVFESGLTLADKELLNRAKQVQSENRKRAIELRMQQELGRLDETYSDEELVTELTKAEIVNKKMKSWEIAAKLAANDIERYGRKAGEAQEQGVTVYNTVVVANRQEIPPMPVPKARPVL